MFFSVLKFPSRIALEGQHVWLMMLLVMRAAISQPGSQVETRATCLTTLEETHLGRRARAAPVSIDKSDAGSRDEIEENKPMLVSSIAGREIEERMFSERKNERSKREVEENRRADEPVISLACLASGARHHRTQHTCTDSIAYRTKNHSPFISSAQRQRIKKKKIGKRPGVQDTEISNHIFDTGRYNKNLDYSK